MVKNLLTITVNGAIIESQITANGKKENKKMDGYRRTRTSAYTGATGAIGRVGARVVRKLRGAVGTLASDKIVRHLRYALGVASFIFMLGVVAAMETGLISLAVGMFICIGIGISYLVLGHEFCDEDEE